MIQVDPGVDDGDADAAGRARGCCRRRSDAPNAWRCCVSGQQWNEADRYYRPVDRDVGHVGVGSHASELDIGELGREAMQCVLVDVIALEAMRPL